MKLFYFLRKHINPGGSSKQDFLHKQSPPLTNYHRSIETLILFRRSYDNLCDFIFLFFFSLSTYSLFA